MKIVDSVDQISDCTFLFQQCFQKGFSVMWESSKWLGKKNCEEYWLKELQESMDGCTGRRDITEILLKTALNTTQSIDQQSVFFFESMMPLPGIIRDVRRFDARPGHFSVNF